MLKKQSFSGKTLDDAITQAARTFGVEKVFVCYDIQKQSSGGILSKLFSRSIKIEAWVENIKEDLQAAAREAVREILDEKTQEKVQEKIPVKRFKDRVIEEEKKYQEAEHTGRIPSISIDDPKVKSLLDEFNLLFCKAFSISFKQMFVEIEKEHNAINIQIEDSFLEDLLTKSEKLALAYEHIFKRVAQKRIGDLNARFSLFAGESSEKREERLIAIAKALAEKVRKTGKSVILSSKSGQERRTIHLALDTFDGIATRSIGMGEHRRLVIYSTNKEHKKEYRNRRSPLLKTDDDKDFQTKDLKITKFKPKKNFKKKLNTPERS